jgi:hypothetical protein
VQNTEAQPIQSSPWLSLVANCGTATHARRVVAVARPDGWPAVIGIGSLGLDRVDPHLTRFLSPAVSEHDLTAIPDGKDATPTASNHQGFQRTDGGVTVLTAAVKPKGWLPHRVSRRLRHRAVALGGVEARDGTGELEVVGEWDVAEVALLLLPGLVEGNGLERRHLRPHIRSVSASIHIDTRTDRN